MSTSSPSLLSALIVGAVLTTACDQPDDTPERVAAALRLVEDQRFDEALALVDAAPTSSEPSDLDLASFEPPELPPLPDDAGDLVAELDPLEVTCNQSYYHCIFAGCGSEFFFSLDELDDCYRTCYCLLTFCNGSSCLMEGV